jgi:hypothetical protein
MMTAVLPIVANSPKDCPDKVNDAEDEELLVGEIPNRIGGEQFI